MIETSDELYDLFSEDLNWLELKTYHSNNKTLIQISFSSKKANYTEYAKPSSNHKEALNNGFLLLGERIKEAFSSDTKTRNLKTDWNERK